MITEPQVEIQEGDSVQEAEAAVGGAYEAVGGTVLAFENLNSFLPISNSCHFLQASFSDQEWILVVMTQEWDEKNLLTVLNVLLEIRMDPDPPGQLPRFRFYGPYAPPPVLLTLFGDTGISDFECRAALIAHFGRDLNPAMSLQLAAAATHLLRESLGLDLSSFDEAGFEHLDQAVLEHLRAAKLPDEGAPLNALICLGFLYGELLQSLLGAPARWLQLKDSGPWPVLVFEPVAPAPSVPKKDDSQPNPPASAGAEQADLPPYDSKVVYNPVGAVMALYQEGGAGRLAKGYRDLEQKLAELPRGTEVPSPGGPADA